MDLKHTFYIVFLVFFSLGLEAQEVRTFDGTRNNQEHPNWGAVGAPLERIAPLAFEDGYQAPAAPERGNPRAISNRLVNQSRLQGDASNRSDYIWAFGQFIDHEFTLIPFDENDPIHISVPTCDSFFDKDCFGVSRIPMSRSIFVEGTGTEVGNPRLFPNQITHWIDGSAVYGSDLAHANWLRTFQDGKLKVSQGDLLPFNTISGEFNSPIDPEAPHMENMNPLTTRLFVAGDPRVNENPNLVSMHTLFVREHNTICDRLIEAHPDWSDEELYQHARRLVSGMIQHITYDEWLPALGIELDAYTGYDSEINPAILVEFSAAAFRMGHTLVSSRIIRMNDACDQMPSGNMDLRSAFFNPRPILQDEGIEPFLKGMSAQVQQHFDCNIVSDLRNFLFMAPEAGIGMDLASININRGREMGLPDFNTIRTSLGLPKIQTFDELCSQEEFANGLQEVYGHVDNIDPWIGLLAEDHAPNMMFGTTVGAILKEQFQRLRDGDRFYFEIDPGLSPEEVEYIRNTKLSDIILRNAKLQLMQEEVFFAAPKCDLSQLDLVERKLEMRVYPNPAVDYFNLAVYGTEEEETIQYQLVSAQGVVLDESELSLNRGINVFRMPLQDQWANGVYNILLRTSNGDRRNNTKLLKVRQ